MPGTAAARVPPDAEHAHPERGRNVRRAPADRTDADEKQRLARQLENRVALSPPLARGLAHERGRQLHRERQQERKDVLGDGDRVDAGRVRENKSRSASSG